MIFAGNIYAGWVMSFYMIDITFWTKRRRIWSSHIIAIITILLKPLVYKFMAKIFYEELPSEEIINFVHLFFFIFVRNIYPEWEISFSIIDITCWTTARIIWSSHIIAITTILWIPIAYKFMETIFYEELPIWGNIQLCSLIWKPENYDSQCKILGAILMRYLWAF